jgi:UDP-N-acetylglucosamine 4,6-dehydratase
MYVVQPAEALWFGQEWKDRGKAIADDFRYASNTNDVWLNIDQIKAMITPIDYTIEQGMAE